MSKIINDEQGNFQDLSDEGQQLKQLTDSLELELALNKLSEEEQVIVRKINEGYSHREIAKELSINKDAVRRTLDKILDIIK